MLLSGSPFFRLSVSAIFVHPIRIRANPDALVNKLKTCQRLRLLSCSNESNTQNSQNTSLHVAFRCRRQFQPDENISSSSLKTSPIIKQYVSLTSNGHRYFSTSIFNRSPSKPTDSSEKVETPTNLKTTPKGDSATRQRFSMSMSQIKGELMKVPGTGGLTYKDLWKKYGIPFVIWYSTLYFGGFAASYIIIDSGILGITGSNFIDWISSTFIGNYINVTRIDPKYGSIGAAIVANEILELARLPLAIFTIPYIAAAWEKRRGRLPGSKNRK